VLDGGGGDDGLDDGGGGGGFDGGGGGGGGGGELLTVLLICWLAEPLPLQLSTAITWKFIWPRFMPYWAQALKWFCSVMVPLLVHELRMLMYCWKVDVPWIEGWLTC
jgi:hypothetical protein